MCVRPVVVDLGDLRTIVTRSVAGLPRHEDYLKQHCAAEKLAGVAA